MRHTSGTLLDMHQASLSASGKSLNSLDFPMQCAEHPPQSFATDVKAWTRTLRNSNCRNSIQQQVLDGVLQQHPGHTTNGISTLMALGPMSTPKLGVRSGLWQNQRIWDVSVILLTGISFMGITQWKALTPIFGI